MIKESGGAYKPRRPTAARPGAYFGGACGPSHRASQLWIS